MPQYAYSINGRRHVFEGPDPQTTARFAQRWAAQEAGRTPVTVADIQRRLGSKPSQFATDLGSRANQDLADLTGAIADVKAHPTNLLNAPKILSAVARYVPNAFGLLPSTGVDQVTGPVVRGINSRFRTHFDPRYATDQLLGAVGILPGEAEALAAETSLARAGETADEIPRVASEAGEPSQLIPPKSAPPPTVAYRAPKILKNVLGQNSAKEAVVPLSDGFVYNHQRRQEALQDLPEDIQDKYYSAISDHIIDPILDDPDYHGHNAATVQNILRELTTMAGEQRGSGGSPRLADALDAANEDFRAMVNQQQPEMAKELGLSAVGGSSDPAADASQIRPPGELVNFEQHVPPPKDRVAPPSAGVNLDKYGEDIGDYLRKVVDNFGAPRVKLMLKAWKDMDLTANDNSPMPNWAGKVPRRKPANYPVAEDFEPPTPLRDTMTFPEKLAWMKTAANDNGPPMPDEYLQNYLAGLWGPPQREGGMGGRAPGTKLYPVWSAPPPSPTNAFSGAPPSPQNPDLTTGPGALRQVNAFDVNTLRPPRLFGPTTVGASDQAQDPPPKN